MMKNEIKLLLGVFGIGLIVAVISLIFDTDVGLVWLILLLISIAYMAGKNHKSLKEHWQTIVGFVLIFVFLIVINLFLDYTFGPDSKPEGLYWAH